MRVSAFLLRNGPDVKRPDFNPSVGYFRVPSGQGKLENLEKGLFLEKVRENLEKSGSFCKISHKSGKSQGIVF